MALMLVGFGLVALIDLVPLIKRRSRRGVAGFLVMLATALTLAVLEAKGIDVPSIMLLWGDVLRPLGLSY